MKTKAKDKSKLWGMVCGSVSPSDRSQLARIVNLDQLCSNRPWNFEKWRTQLLMPGVACHTVELDGRVLAFAVVHRTPTKIRVTDILVHAEFRRIGVGRLLLDYLEVVELNDVRSSMELIVDESDLDTQKFLRKCKIPAIAVLRGEPYGTYLFKHDFKALS